MDGNNEKPLWEPTADFPQLRRPYLRTIQEPAPEPLQDVAQNSTLSVEAEEWYPPGYTSSGTVRTNQTSITPNSVQNRLNKYKQNSTSDCENNLSYLDEVIKLLTLKPGKFDDVIFALLEFLEPFFKEMEVISDITSVIFRQAITESNFQYTGARLFAILDEQCPIMRSYLHSLCEKELENTTNLQNLTLFYAEIYSQMNYELFGKCLLKALEKLALKPENVKQVCQTLKLTGAKLEALDKPLITSILNRLENWRMCLTPSMSSLVQSVIKLRESHWGQQQPESPETKLEPDVPPEPDSYYGWQDGPVFYGPDGMQLTAEENDFLRENLNEDCLLDDGDPDALWNPEPEMNEEIQAAFAEFLRTSYR